MRLLVSVRSAGEVGPALAGGADIIDAKEPSRGTLGPVDPGVLAAVAKGLPGAIPLSVALGDPMGEAEVERAVGRLAVQRRAGEVILKLGFAGTAGEAVVRNRLAAAIAVSARTSARPTLVAVAYADWTRAAAPPPEAIVHAAAMAGARGVLLDTFTKNGGDLFTWLSPDEVRIWIGEARAAGLLVAVAGSLQTDSLALLTDPLPDVVGVRGAACEGGRQGRISADRIGALRVVVDALNGRAGSPPVPAKRQKITPQAVS